MMEIISIDELATCSTAELVKKIKHGQRTLGITQEALSNNEANGYGNGETASRQRKTIQALEQNITNVQIILVRDREYTNEQVTEICASASGDDSEFAKRTAARTDEQLQGWITRYTSLANSAYCTPDDRAQYTSRLKATQDELQRRQNKTQ